MGSNVRARSNAEMDEQHGGGDAAEVHRRVTCASTGADVHRGRSPAGQMDEARPT